jgi:hypothetical protein
LYEAKFELNGICQKKAHARKMDSH